MMRVACVFALIALGVLVAVAVHLDGATATAFTFVGLPALAVALTLYVVQRWRAGAFRLDGTSRPATH